MLEDIDEKVRGGELVVDRSLVPVVWDLLVPLLGNKVIFTVSIDTEEGGKGLSVQVPFRVLLGVVGHHARWERVGGGRYEDTSKGRIGEVWVGVH